MCPHGDSNVDYGLSSPDLLVLIEIRARSSRGSLSSDSRMHAMRLRE